MVELVDLEHEVVACGERLVDGPTGIIQSIIGITWVATHDGALIGYTPQKDLSGRRRWVVKVPAWHRWYYLTPDGNTSSLLGTLFDTREEAEEALALHLLVRSGAGAIRHLN